MPYPNSIAPKSNSAFGIPFQSNRFAALEVDEDVPQVATEKRDAKSSASVDSGAAPVRKGVPTSNPVINIDLSSYSRATSLMFDDRYIPDGVPAEYIAALREVEVVFDPSKTSGEEPFRYPGETPLTESGAYQSPLIAADAFRNRLGGDYEFGPVHVDEMGNVSRREAWTCSPTVSLCLVGAQRGLAPQVDAARDSIVPRFDQMFAPGSSSVPTGFAMGIMGAIGVLSGFFMGGALAWAYFSNRPDDDAAHVPAPAEGVNNLQNAVNDAFHMLGVGGGADAAEVPPAGEDLEGVPNPGPGAPGQVHDGGVVDVAPGAPADVHVGHDIELADFHPAGVVEGEPSPVSSVSSLASEASEG